MKLQTLPVSVVLAASIGAVHTYLVTLAWVYIAIYTPLPHWLVSHGITGAAFKAVVFPTDLLTNLVLCAPAAYLLCRLRPAKLWVYLAAAVLPGFVWQYRLVLTDMTLLREWQLFLPGALMGVLALPATALIIRWFMAGPPNDLSKWQPSFKAAG